jgi:hypothetical protein
MNRKILIIAIDKTNNISKDLARINKPHIFCNIDNTEMYDSIKDGVYKYVDKFFITTYGGIVDKLLEDFPRYLIVYVESTTNNMKYPMNVEIYQNINEPIYKYMAGGMGYLTTKEIDIYTSKNITMNATKIDLNIILSGKIELSTSISKIKRILDSIIHNRILSEKYVLDTIDTLYCGNKKDVVKNMLSLNNAIDFLDEQNHQHDMLQHIKYTNLYDLVDRTKYLHYWRGLRSALNFIQTQSPEPNAIQNIQITMVLDVSQIDPLCGYINVKDQILDILDHLDQENIYMCSDVLAIGTTKIMHYYMTMYGYYGSYRFKEHIRDVSDNGIMSPEQYRDMPPEMTLRSDVQLFEHIHRFTDLVISRVKPYILNKLMPDEIVKKKNIILVTYYGIYEQFIYVESIFQKLGYVVHDFPCNKTINEKGSDGCVDAMCQMIDDYKPDFVLWWILNIEPNNLHKIVMSNMTVKHLYFNWDEPYNWTHCNLASKARYLDIAYITCSETVEKFIGSGAKHAYCLYTGYHPELHRPYWLDGSEIEYKYDVSFICTNLYSDKNAYPDPIVDRKRLIDTIYQNQKLYGYTLAIFGSENFKELYPDSYKGFVKYNDTVDIFNSSKINLCTHVVGNKKGYLNERVFMIMGSGGLLMVDPVPGVDDILVNGENCMMMNQNRIVRQIKSILSNYQYYHRIKQNGYTTAKKYTWDDWGMRIEEKIKINYS